MPDRCRIPRTLDFWLEVAILQKDVLDYAKQRNLVPHIKSWMTYIATLYNKEFHLIARPEIKSTSIVRKGRMTEVDPERATAGAMS